MQRRERQEPAARAREIRDMNKVAAAAVRGAKIACGKCERAREERKKREEKVQESKKKKIYTKRAKRKARGASVYKGCAVVVVERERCAARVLIKIATI